MVRHYAYRMDHDTGFAPHASDSICTLCGCKTTSVERWAQPGSWVIGIGGKGTGKPDALIYALRVDATPSLAQFRRESPAFAAYLRGRSLNPSSRVLVSRRFYYLGTNAIPLPADLHRLVIQAQGCKRIANEDMAQLLEVLAQRFTPGVYGSPNNPRQQLDKRCGCGRANSRLEQTSGKRLPSQTGQAADRSAVRR